MGEMKEKERKGDESREEERRGEERMIKYIMTSENLPIDHWDVSPMFLSCHTTNNMKKKNIQSMEATDMSSSLNIFLSRHNVLMRRAFTLLLMDLRIAPHDFSKDIINEIPTMEKGM